MFDNLQCFAQYFIIRNRYLVTLFHSGGINFRNKIMEYYSKLNMEVEKSKMHTEWKIKRLQLDQSRMQLLSTEERNLKREKLELEHQKQEEVMAMSIQSIDYSKSEDEVDDKDDSEEKTEDLENGGDKMTESVQSVVMEDVEEKPHTPVDEKNKSTVAQTSSTMISAICNAAKNFFGVSKTHSEHCDNNKELDEQGNIVQSKTEQHSVQHTTSASDIGSKLDQVNDNLEFHKVKHAALLNKQKVMAHEFGQTDEENNEVKDRLLHLASIDEENNVQDGWTPFIEAKRNRLKVLGTEFDIVKPPSAPVTCEPRTDAQREALINKQKVLGVEYNLPAEPYVCREPANKAQEEAVQNKKRIMGADCETVSTEDHPKREIAKRSGLTLNLKPYGEDTGSGYSLGVTPNTGAVTPGDIFPRVSTLLHNIHNTH